MFKLGMIYKYGYSQGLDEFYKGLFSKFEVVLDEKTAFEWFLKSYDTFLNDRYQESIFAKSRNAGDGNMFTYFIDGSDFYSCISALKEFYKKGVVVPKDKNKVKELEVIKNNYRNLSKKRRFSNIDSY